MKTPAVASVSKWLLSLLAMKPVSAWAWADPSVPRKFSVKRNLNVRDDRVINVTTQTWMHLPFFLRCEKNEEKTSQNHLDICFFNKIFPANRSTQLVLGCRFDVWHDLCPLIPAVMTFVYNISWKKYDYVITVLKKRSSIPEGKEGRLPKYLTKLNAQIEMTLRNVLCEEKWI